MANEVRDVNPKEKMWLVRASTKIQGPYSLDDIVQLLMFNQISFVDEIRRPKSRWNFIREYPYLVEIIKSKRDAINNEQTKTNPVTTSTQITQTASNAGLPSKVIEVNFDEIKDIEPLKETPFSFSPKGKTISVTSGKSFGSLEDENVKSQMSTNHKKMKSKVIFFSLAIVFIMVGFKGLQKYQEVGKVKEKINQISRLYNLKLYEDAFRIYEELKENNELSNEIKSQINAARITFGKESSQVRNQVLKSLDKISDIKKKGELLSLVGLSYQFEGDFFKAAEFYQNSAIQDPNNESAVLNSLGLEILKNKDFVKYNQTKKNALNFYKHLADVRPENFENINYFQFLKALFNLELKEDLKEEISINVNELFAIKNKSSFLKNEIQVVSIGLKKSEGSLTDNDYIELIESLPKQGKKFARNPSVNWSLTDWSFLEDLCDKIVGQENQLMPLLFKAYCSLEAGQYEKVETLLSKSLLLAKGSNHHDLMQLHLAFIKGETIKIDSLLKKTDLSNFAVTHYYRGMHCLNNKNNTCAKEAFTNLLNSFSNWGFLAQLGLYLADNKTSKQNIYEGSRKEPMFLPLLLERSLFENKE
ncbi:MAG: hypothetical protein J0M15_05155 [Deltaproteobacteria bacterium]|jgi:tetratricopeptide (TPR) repeat protein|nr:hypothetical protein [Deltaproteobacteria bacterium]